MKYVVCYTANTIGKQAIVEAESVSVAHQAAEMLPGVDFGSIRVYNMTTDEGGAVDVTSVEAAALTIVRCVIRRAISKEGTARQFYIYNAAYSYSTNSDNHDFLDCLQEAKTSLLSAIGDGLPVREQYRMAYADVEKFLYKNRITHVSVTANRHVTIEELNGDLVDAGNGISAIVKNGERYNPTLDIRTEDKRKAQKDAIADITSHLTPVQKKVLFYMKRGMSVRQIADKIGRAPSSVQDTVNRIRSTALKLYPDGMKTF